MLDYETARAKMVETQVAARGIRDPRVLEAMRRVPRHVFVPEALRERAYQDHPVGIGAGQTISQPYMVALMTESLRLSGGEKVLEVGTGSGYQTAVLRALGARVYSIERLPEIRAAAEENLRAAGVEGAVLRTGDGTLGWPEEAPFDRMMVTAGAPSLPVRLVEQLKDGGAMVIPVGDGEEQELLLVERGAGRVTRRRICACVFVKLVGEEGWSSSPPA